MLHLTHDTEQLARRLAARVGRKPEDLIRAALEREATALGASDEPQPKRRPNDGRINARHWRQGHGPTAARSAIPPRDR